MKINCENCGFEYDTEEQEECPACGDDNESLIKEGEGEDEEPSKEEEEDE